MAQLDDDETDPGAGVDRARASYEDSLKRLHDTDALTQRVDDVVGSIRGERRVNHWAEKTRAALRGAA